MNFTIIFSNDNGQDIYKFVFIDGKIHSVVYADNVAKSESEDIKSTWENAHDEGLSFRVETDV